MSTALVSICVPTYAGEKFIAETIRSVLEQSYEFFELIVVDDCSPDSTQRIVESISDSRIRYIRNKQNLGPEGNWNRCLELVSGKYYKLLPHDDILSPDCLEAQVAILEADMNQNIALVFGGKTIIDSSGRRIADRLPLGKRPIKMEANRLINKCVMSGSNIIGEPGSGLIRSELIAKVGTYDATFPYVIDLDYWFRVLLYGDAYYLGKVVSCFRISDQAWSTKIGNKQHSDYVGMVKRASADERYQLGVASKVIGILNSYVISYLRRVLYILLRIFKPLTRVEKS